MAQGRGLWGVGGTPTAAQPTTTTGKPTGAEWAAGRQFGSPPGGQPALAGGGVTAGGGAAQQPYYYQGWGGGGGGGGVAAAATPTWTGAIPGAGFLPWQQWEQVPWAQAPEGRSAEAQAWFNVMMPWMQQAVQAQQWGESFDWRKAIDEWTQQFQQQQFGWQQEQDVWARAFQEAEAQRQQEIANVQTFGRRWRPQTRWM